MSEINFEQDKEDLLSKTDNIQSLADQVKTLEAIDSNIKNLEEDLKQKKKEFERLSGEIIPTMLSEMGLSELRLQDGSSIKVSTSYKAHISEANKEAAFNWLRKNGLGDIIKNEISVSFGRTKITRRLIMPNLRKVMDFNRHKS